MSHHDVELEGCRGDPELREVISDSVTSLGVLGSSPSYLIGQGLGASTEVKETAE